jgi:hypothetical protein
MPNPTSRSKGQERDTAVIERRAFVRFGCNLDTSLRPIGHTRQDPWLGTVFNISRGGVGLVLHRRFETGTLLAIELQGRDGLSSGTLLARVAHVTPRGDAEWTVGCAFVHELSEDDLKALVPEAF